MKSYELEQLLGRYMEIKSDIDRSRTLGLPVSALQEKRLHNILKLCHIKTIRCRSFIFKILNLIGKYICLKTRVISKLKLIEAFIF